MAIASKLTFVSSLFAIHAASAQPMSEPETTGTEQVDRDAEIRPPSSVESEPRPAVIVVAPLRKNRLATTEPWGGGLRLTGMSGIGALPGVNYGGELAVHVRHFEYFGELGFGKWRPQNDYVVTDALDEHTNLGLDVWTVRGGWASMNMPLRAWVLAEVGEIAGAKGMPGVVTRMVMGDTPQDRQWRAAGAGLGIAWPMTPNVRLIGNMEVAVPLNRERLMIDRGQGTYTPDPIAARYSLGLEVGWR